jgi:hypothetical protein
LPWLAFTPTFTNLTLGNGTITSFYSQLGKTVFYRGFLTFGTTTSCTATGIKINLPVTAAANQTFGNALLNDQGVATYMGTVEIESGTTLGLRAIGVSSPYAITSGVVANTTVPFTWGTGDNFRWSVTYQAA